MIRLKDWPDLISADDCVRLLDWGRVYAYKVFARPDFPLIDKSKKRYRQVTREALWAWLNREVAT